MSELAGKMAAAFVMVILITVVIGLFIALPIMWLWNATMPDIFGVPHITFWQAFGLKLLAAFLITPTTFEKS